MFVLQMLGALSLLLCLCLVGCNGGTSTAKEAGGDSADVPGTSVTANENDNQNTNGNDNTDQNDNAGDDDAANDNAAEDQEAGSGGSEFPVPR